MATAKKHFSILQGKVNLLWRLLENSVFSAWVLLEYSMNFMYKNQDGLWKKKPPKNNDIYMQMDDVQNSFFWSLNHEYQMVENVVMIFHWKKKFHWFNWATLAVLGSVTHSLTKPCLFVNNDGSFSVTFKSSENFWHVVLQKSRAACFGTSQCLFAFLSVNLEAAHTSRNKS